MTVGVLPRRRRALLVLAILCGVAAIGLVLLSAVRLQPSEVRLAIANTELYGPPIAILLGADLLVFRAMVYRLDDWASDHRVWPILGFIGLLIVANAVLIALVIWLFYAIVFAAILAHV